MRPLKRIITRSSRNDFLTNYNSELLSYFIRNLCFVLTSSLFSLTCLGPIFNESILKRAQEKKKVAIHVHDLRDYTDDKKHRKVDDRPFGGGPGMVMMPQPLFDAIKAIKGRRKAKVIYTSPAGKPFTQIHAKTLD